MYFPPSSSAFYRHRGTPRPSPLLLRPLLQELSRPLLCERIEAEAGKILLAVECKLRVVYIHESRVAVFSHKFPGGQGSVCENYGIKTRRKRTGCVCYSWCKRWLMVCPAALLTFACGRRQPRGVSLPSPASLRACKSWRTVCILHALYFCCKNERKINNIPLHPFSCFGAGGFSVSASEVRSFRQRAECPA